MERLEQVEIFDFHTSRPGTFVRQTHPQKLHSQLMELLTAIMYQVAGLTCSFTYGMGLQTEDVIRNSLVGQAHHLLFLHVRPANQPKIRAAYIYHKKVGQPLFSQSRVNRYQLFVSFHYA